MASRHNTADLKANFGKELEETTRLPEGRIF